MYLQVPSWFTFALDVSTPAFLVYFLPLDVSTSASWFSFVPLNVSTSAFLVYFFAPRCLYQCLPGILFALDASTSAFLVYFFAPRCLYQCLPGLLLCPWMSLPVLSWCSFVPLNVSTSAFLV
jgi:hypothetical protein